MSAGSSSAGSSNERQPPPLDLLLFLKEETGEDLFSLPLDKLYNRLYSGVILRNKEKIETQLFWLDEKSNTNCFMLLPKSLNIQTYSPPSYDYEKENRSGIDIIIPLVKYQKVRWVVVYGKFRTMALSPGKRYAVVLLVELIRESCLAVTAKKLSLPDGSRTQEPWGNDEDIPAGKPYEIKVGSFSMNPNNVGELSFVVQIYFWGRPDIKIRGVAMQPTA